MSVVEEAFSRAMRLRLKDHPYWGWTPLPANHPQPVILEHVETGERLRFESTAQAANYIGLGGPNLTRAYYALANPKRIVRGYRILKIET